MKKKIVSVILGLFFIVQASFSQAAVIDVSAIAAAIENGITMYKQLENAYNQYKNMIEQLKMISKDMLLFDPRQYDWNEWDSILKLTDHYMSQIDNIDNIINRKSMYIGGLRFSMKDLYTTDFYSKLDSTIGKELDPSLITETEKAQFYKKHGLSVRHYNKLKALSNELHDNAVETAAKVSIMENEDEIVMQQIKDFKEASGMTSGTVDNLQLAAKIQSQTLQDVKEISIMIRDLSQMQLQMNVLTQTEKEIEEESLNEQQEAPYTPFNDFYKQGGKEELLMGPGRN